MKTWKRLVCAISAAATLFGACAGLGVTAGADDEQTTKRENTTQINVTAPLYVCMYASWNSGHVTPPSENAYKLKNYTDAEVIVTTVQGFSEAWELSPTAVTDLGPREIYMTLNGVQLTTAKRYVSWNLGVGTQGEKRENGSSYTEYPISITAAIAGDGRNLIGEFKACRVQYTFKLLPIHFQLDYTSQDQYTNSATAKTVGVAPASVDADKYIPVTISDMAADGYIFKGWTDSTDLTSTKEVTVVNPVDGSERKATVPVANWYYPGMKYSADRDLTLYAQWAIDYGSKFHASSNYLEVGGAAYDVADPDGEINIELYNYEKTNTALVCGQTNTDANLRAGMTLQYTVVADVNGQAANVKVDIDNGGTVACDGSTKTITKLKITPATGKSWNEDDVIKVRVTATDPDHAGTGEGQVTAKVMEGTFTVTTPRLPEYTVANNANGTVTVQVRTNDYNGNITVNWPTASMTPDNTNDLMQSWVNSGTTSSGTLTCVQDTVYTLTFFGKANSTAGGTAAESGATVSITLS